MATSSEADVAAKLIERLLMDPAFRARFRRNPAEACREAGLEELAEEMQMGAGKAMMTLDMRESKSSLAGVMMAAAMEGVGIMQFAEHVAPHLDDIPEAIGDVLSRVNLPAIGGSLAPPPSTTAPPPPDGGKAADAADAAADPAAAGGNGAAPASAAAPAAASAAAPEAAPGGAAATPEAAAAAEKGDAAAAAKPKTAAEAAAEKIAKEDSPEAKQQAAADKAVADITEDSKDLPSATDLPDDTSTPQASVDIGPDGKALTPEQAAAAQPAAPSAAAPVAAADPAAAPAPSTPSAPPAAVETPGAPPVEPSGKSSGAAADVADQAGQGGQRRPVDPSEFGQDGTGGALSPEGAELLKNKNLEFDSVGIADLKAGKIDPRVVAVLTKLSEDHKLKISCMCSDHSKFTTGGSISNHAYGRGLDIASVDGEIVNPGSTAARELASELSTLPEKYRPDEIGSPWPISGPGYFTDAGHQDHVHVGFKQEIDKSWAPPADVTAGGAQAAAVAPAAPAVPAAAGAAPAAAVAAAPPAPGAPAAAAAVAPEPKKGQSGQFMAAAAQASSAGKKGASGFFLAPQPPAGPASAIAPPASVPGMVDATAAAAPGAGGSSAGTAALKVAQTQLGVQEAGTNTGKEVDEYLAAAKVGPGNPWCASFVTWSLEKAGVKMDGTGWAAVQTWVRNAEAGKNNLEIVSADQARPGDIVAYDWGHQDDFGSDGHIGFLASNVEGGKFTALEGNNQDQVMKVPRGVDMANVKFIRVNADVPGGAPPMASPAPAGVADQAAPGGGAGAADVAAAAVDTGGANPYPGDDAGKAQLAAWMGREAEKRGLPKQLPVMASLVESGVKNLNFGDADSVGFFQMRVGIWNKGEYAGFPEKPELQVKWFLDQAEAVKKQRVAAGKSVTDPNQFGDWIADVERPAEQYRGRYGLRLGEANGLLGSAGSAPPAPAAAAAAAPAPAGAPVAAAAAAPPVPKPGESGQFMAAAAQAAEASGGKKGASGMFMAAQPPAGPASAVAAPGAVPGMVDATAAAAGAPGGAGSTLGASAFKVAQSQLGVHEAGTNTGKEVDEYLAAADVGPGNPWCASFITWSLQKAGHKMDGSGWAAVQTWVRNAEAGKNDLKIISADQARPGDIVAYDWGKQDDFGSDGHIGFVASEVKGGKFTALEGNNQDQVMRVPRDTNMANVKFIRIGGDAPAPAAGAVPAATPDGAGVADAVSAAAGSGGGGNPYPGDNAGKAQLAAWLGREAEKRGLPKQLPVMASLVESGVKNLNYGDADSVGFFQMRVGIWNKGEYAGFPEKPELQAKWFLDQAEAVKKQRIARGQSVTDPKQFGDWIADIERPAEQYRGRYALRLGEANGLLGSAGSAPPAAVEQVAAASPAPAASAVAGDAVAAAAGGGGGGAGPKALAALKEAEKYTGTKYKWGGSTPQTGFDCSGLVQWAYAKAGIQIPRVTDAQFSASSGTPVDRGDLRPGDLVFFGEPGNIYHVGISMGGDKFLHAPKTGDVVKVASLKESYFSSNYAGGRRFDTSEPVAGAAAAAAPAAPAVAAAAPAIDPKAVAEAQAAVARDAAEVNRQGSGLFMAIKSQEERRHQTVQFMQAIDPKAAKTADAPQAAAAAAPAAAEPAAAAPAAAPAAATDPADAAGTGSGADPGEPVQLPDDISDDYPGNNASKDEIAKWLAKQADKHGLPPELPVMASLVESGVKNLNYGDADSVGFFQMRVGIWNQGDYKGFPEHPELQAKWFIDQAVAVKKRAIASGDADFGKDPSKWGEWIADIERPAEQYRGRYQLRLREARGLLKA